MSALILKATIIIVAFPIWGIVQLIKFFASKAKVAKENSKELDKEKKKRKIVLTAKEKKHEEYIRTHSKRLGELLALNEKYSFKEFKSRDYSKRCNSLREYQKIDEHEYLKEKINQDLLFYKENIKKADENLRLWRDYQAKCVKISPYLTRGEIEKLPDRKIKVKVFESVERKLFEKQRLEEPYSSFFLKVTVSYESPKGRNSYEKTAILLSHEIKKLIPEIEMEAEEKKRQEKLLFEEKQKKAEEREREKNRQNAERERQKLIVQEVRDKERELERIKKQEEREKEKARQREERERQKLLEKEERRKILVHTAAENKKKYEELKKREELLEKREEEFKQATQGHIYSLTQPHADIASYSKQVETKEDDSVWVKLKSLKVRFDHGEISHVEYEEKRNELLKRSD